MCGVSWLAVENTVSFLSLPTASQAQPEPNCARPAVLTTDFIWSAPLNTERIAVSTSALGAPAPPGVIRSQKKVWFQWPPRLLRTPVRSSPGTTERLARISSIGFLARSGHLDRKSVG